MSRKKKYPNWFSAYCEPRFYRSKPEELLTKRVVKECIKCDNGSLIELSDGKTYQVDLDLDYSGCYYEGDTPSIKLSLQAFEDTFEDTFEKDPDYKRKLKSYEKEKVEHREKLKEWKRLKAIWDEEEAFEKECREKAEFERLAKSLTHSHSMEDIVKGVIYDRGKATLNGETKHLSLVALIIASDESLIQADNQYVVMGSCNVVEELQKLVKFKEPYKFGQIHHAIIHVSTLTPDQLDPL